MLEDVSIRIAQPSDRQALLQLMPGYYAADGLVFDVLQAEAAIARLLAEPQWGCVWLIEAEGNPVGYLALCLGFSLEAGGNDAFVDELYVLPAYRGRGLGRRVLTSAVEEARRRGVRTLHLLVQDSNVHARALYGALGFKRREGFSLMSRSLAP